MSIRGNSSLRDEIEGKISLRGKSSFKIKILHILARKQLHCRRFGRSVSHELRGDDLGGARRRSDFFITLHTERYVCIYYIYIVCFTFPRECNDKYMYANTTCCSSRSLTSTARQKRLLWSFYMPQYVKYLPNL